MKNRKHLGFTLFEVLLATAATGLLFGFGMSAMETHVDKGIGEEVQDALFRDLTMARQLAVTNGGSVSVCASSDGKRCSGKDWSAGWIVYQGHGKVFGQIVSESDLVASKFWDVEGLAIKMIGSKELQGTVSFTARGFNGVGQRLAVVSCVEESEILDQHILVEPNGNASKKLQVNPSILSRIEALPTSESFSWGCR